SSAFKIHGAVYLTNKLGGGRFNDEDAAVLRRMTAEAAAAYENSVLYSDLRKSEEQFRSLFETANDVIFILNPDGTMKELNPACEKVFGWNKKEWIGRHFAGVIHPDDLPEAGKDVQAVLEGGNPSARRNRVLCESGQYR